jgi:hypothetical protein
MNNPSTQYDYIIIFKLVLRKCYIIDCITLSKGCHYQYQIVFKLIIIENVTINYKFFKHMQRLIFAIN